MINIGKNLKYYRKKRGYTQEKLAELISVSTETIKSIENKNKVPRLDNFIKLCNVLNIPSDYLLNDENKVFEIQTIDLLLNEFKKYNNYEKQFYVETLQNIINHKENIDNDFK